MVWNGKNVSCVLNLKKGHISTIWKEHGADGEYKVTDTGRTISQK